MSLPLLTQPVLQTNNTGLVANNPSFTGQVATGGILYAEEQRIVIDLSDVVNMTNALYPDLTPLLDFGYLADKAIMDMAVWSPDDLLSLTFTDYSISETVMVYDPSPLVNSLMYDHMQEESIREAADELIDHLFPNYGGSRFYYDRTILKYNNQVPPPMTPDQQQVYNHMGRIQDMCMFFGNEIYMVIRQQQILERTIGNFAHNQRTFLRSLVEKAKQKLQDDVWNGRHYDTGEITCELEPDGFSQQVLPNGRSSAMASFFVRIRVTE